MAQLVVAFVAGLIFAAGLIISEMSNPAKVLSFLDVMGDWDPTLALVMGGALLVTFPAFGWVLKRSAPLLGASFVLPTKQQLDTPLLAGSAIFGVGWGLAGLCPGPALTAAGTGAAGAIVFVAAMMTGTLLARHLLEPYLESRRHVPQE